MGAPTVGRMMADILPYLGVEADYTARDLEIMDRNVPNVTNLPLQQAKELLEAQHLSYRVIGLGDKVTQQIPRIGAMVAANSQILLFAGAEPSEDLEEVPDLTYLTYDVARQRLGYQALFICAEGNSIADPNRAVVLRQSIAPGEMVEHGTVVKVSMASNDESTNARA